MRKRKRQAVKKLIQCAAVIAAGVLAIILFSNLLRVVQEQQETIEKQSRLIADLIATLESWEQTAGYDGEELKERAKDLQLRERQDL